MDDNLALALTLRDAKDRADPLAKFGWPSDIHKRAGEQFSRGVEVHHRAGNMGGKTRTMMAVFAALCEAKRELAGVRLPVFEHPVDLAVLVPDYIQAVDSSNKALFACLGDWPHVAGWVNKARLLLGNVAIRPKGWHNDDPSTWSKVLFVSQNDSDPRSIEGQRWDAAGGDEPPDEGFWREARKNAKLRWIAETPLSSARWAWIKRDFYDRGCLNKVVGGRIELVSSLYDNRFLSDDEKRALVESYAGDQFREARINGDYLDVDNLSPWGPSGYAALQRKRTRCQRGGALPITVPGLDVPVVCEQWFRPRDDEQGILSADLSGGIEGNAESGERDPARFDVLMRKSGLHALKWRGYLDAYHVGLAAAHVGEAYNNAWIDFDAGGGYGGPFLRGLLDYRSLEHPNGYRKIVRSERALRVNEVESHYGYKPTDGSRAEGVSAVREWIVMPADKSDLKLRTWDAEALDELSALRLVRTASGALRVAAKDGSRKHDEVLHTFGRLLVLNQSLPWLPEPSREEWTNKRMAEALGIRIPSARKPDGVIDNFGG